MAPVLGCYANNVSLATTWIATRILLSHSILFFFFSVSLSFARYYHSVTLSAPQMSDCAPQHEFYWHCCTYCGIIHWTKWIYELWNHSRGVMMSYHRSALAFVAIKHTDRVRPANMLTLWNMKSCNSRVWMHCVSSFLLFFFFSLPHSS